MRTQLTFLGNFQDSVEGTKRGFIAEIYAGIGRDLLGQSEIEVVGRGGISIGYRFQ